jgi:hypothetical protein
MAPSIRQQALEAFAEYTRLPDLTRLTQRGRDPQTARFDLEFADGTTVPIGTCDNLFSRTKVSRILAVTVGHIVPRCKPSDWEDAIGALIAHATDVTETLDDQLKERCADWLDQYARGALTDREGAAVLREPFTHTGQLHISADAFSRWLKRHYGEQLPPSDLRSALTDLGFKPTRVDYTVQGTGKTRKRSTARYYVAPPDAPGAGE